MLTKVHYDQRTSKNKIRELDKRRMDLVDSLYILVLDEWGDEGKRKGTLELYTPSEVYTQNMKMKAVDKCCRETCPLSALNKYVVVLTLLVTQ